MDLSVITVTWNSSKYIKEQIKSVQSNCGDLRYEQIIVDNNSSDNTVDVVRGCNGVKIITNHSNKGFGKANNQAVNEAKGDYILFLNPDMKMQGDKALEKMVILMERNKDIGLMSCKLVDASGNINLNDGPRRLPTIWDMIKMLFKIPHLVPKVLDRYLYRDIDLYKRQEVETVRGSFMLVRKSIFDEIGGAFDERYFIWFEDIDFCRRVGESKYKIIYDPYFTCQDFVGCSFKKRSQIINQWRFSQSMIQYFKKWEPISTWIWLIIFRPFGLLMAVIAAIVGYTSFRK